MAVVEGLIRSEADGTLSFGNHMLKDKAKKEDFEHNGDLYKVKTYATMTKLEKNGMFAYESVPGTSVNHFEESQDGVDFLVEGAGINYDFTPYNTTIRTENGKVIEMHRIYIP